MSIRSRYTLKRHPIKNTPITLGDIVEINRAEYNEFIPTTLMVVRIYPENHIRHYELGMFTKTPAEDLTDKYRYKPKTMWTYTPSKRAVRWIATDKTIKRVVEKV
jgi:hypothetical protein